MTPPPDQRRRRRPLVRFRTGWLVSLGPLYGASYQALSVQGAYGPGATGGAGSRWQEWHPKGFAGTGTAGHWAGAFYGPLWTLDKAVRHDEARLEPRDYNSSDSLPW